MKQGVNRKRNMKQDLEQKKKFEIGGQKYEIGGRNMKKGVEIVKRGQNRKKKYKIRRITENRSIQIKSVLERKVENSEQNYKEKRIQMRVNEKGENF